MRIPASTFDTLRMAAQAFMDTTASFARKTADDASSDPYATSEEVLYDGEANITASATIIKRETETTRSEKTSGESIEADVLIRIPHQVAAETRRKLHEAHAEALHEGELRTGIVKGVRVLRSCVHILVQWTDL